MAIDKSFQNISSECVLLNQYTVGIKYANRDLITGSDVNNALKALQKISDFMPVKLLRDSMGKKQKYQIISEIAATKKIIGFCQKKEKINRLRY
jgi:hypothetical protein